MQPGLQYRVLVNGPEKTGTHLVVGMLNLLGLRYTSHGPSEFITDKRDDTFGLSTEEFHCGPRLKIWGWPEHGLPVSFVLDRLAQVELGQFCHSHAPYSEELAQIFAALNFRVLQTIRDPRDQVQSMAAWYGDERAPDNARRRELGPLTYEERLKVAIRGTTISNGAGVPGVCQCYEAMSGWYSQPIVHRVRFEDLVGAGGGGDSELQQMTVRACANLVGRSISGLEPEKVASDLFGRSHNFRIGRIGTWRSVFTPQLIDLFKQEANHLLLELGYETNPDWN